MTLLPRIRLWQPTLADHAVLTHAQRLYERTLDAAERIPWIWIERSAIDREPTALGWHKHLILAAVEGELAGLVYGAYLPGFGGYLCYVTVDERFRQHGIATRLYEAFYEAMRADAQAAGEPLRFVLWESHRPEADAKLWEARLRLFNRVGGLWIEGVELQTPNYADEANTPVPLQVFLRPMDEPRDAFDAARLRQVIHDLLERIYDLEPGDALYDATLGPGSYPQLSPACEPAFA